MVTLSLKEQLNSIREQWRENHRLRLGVWAIAAILLLVVLMNFHDAVQRQKQILADAKKKTMQTRRIAEDTRWLQQRDLFAELRGRVASRLMRAKTAGLAQADVRSFIDSILQEEKIKIEIINVASPQPAPPLPNCYSVSVALHGTILPAQLFALLYRLESGPYIVTVDTYHLRPNERQSFTLECRFFVLLKPA